jgi:hypothetical protein
MWVDVKPILFLICATELTFIFLFVLGFEFSVLHLLGRPSTTWNTSSLSPGLFLTLSETIGSQYSQQFYAHRFIHDNNEILDTWSDNFNQKDFDTNTL